MAIGADRVCPEVSADAQLGSCSDRRRGAMILVLRAVAETLTAFHRKGIATLIVVPRPGALVNSNVPFS